jgi:hypothetical protein
MNRSEIVVNTKYLEFEKMFPPFVRDLESGLCTPEIPEDWAWCFDPSQAIVLEKLDGTNVKLEVEDLDLKIFARNQNHKGYVPVSWNDPQYKYIIQAVVNRMVSRSKKLKPGTHYGEALGPIIQKNPYGLSTHEWFTFEPYKDGVQAYKDYPKTSNFDEWKTWVLGLKSLLNPNVEAEGVIFLHRENGRMAKLRKDMFSTAYQHRYFKKK